MSPQPSNDSDTRVSWAEWAKAHAVVVVLEAMKEYRHYTYPRHHYKHRSTPRTLM